MNNYLIVEFPCLFVNEEDFIEMTDDGLEWRIGHALPGPIVVTPPEV